MPVPETDPLIGQPIGNYVLKSLLGVGGMGAVYLAEHPAIGRQVAIKILAAELSMHSRLSERFLSEARALALIEHPNVIEIYDFGKLPDGRLFYVMELLRGLELGKVMNQRGRLTAADVKPYLDQICHGLQATHEKGIIHRDLKPENIFVLNRDPMNIKLLDFGIAKLQHQGMGGITLTQTGMVMGTPLYIAPEQASGEVNKIGPQTDIYSLGVIIYWMISGKPPFFDETPALLLAKHISEEVTPIREVFPSVPAAVADVVERCLAKTPGDRHASANDLRRRFAEAVAEAEAEVAAGEALIPGPADVKALTSMDGEPALEISTGGEEGGTGPDKTPPPLDPDRTVEQAAAGQASPTSAMPGTGEGANTMPAADGEPDTIHLTMPVPMSEGTNMSATTPVPVGVGGSASLSSPGAAGDTEISPPDQAPGFTPPPFKPAKTVGPSSTEITAEIPEVKAAIDDAAQSQGSLEDPTAHTQARTTLRAGAGELIPGKADNRRTWILVVSLAAALLITSVLVLLSRGGAPSPAPMPAYAPHLLRDQGTDDQARPTPVASAATRTDAAADRAKKRSPKKRPGKPTKGTKPRPGAKDNEVFPDPFKAQPQKAPKPAPKKPTSDKPNKPTPDKAKNPKADKPKKIGEGTMQF